MAITVYQMMPIPPDEEATRFVEIGPLRVGVELRFLDEAGLSEAYGDDADAMAEIDANKPAAGVEDRGISLHVFGDDGREYLRFDLFEAGPHYHYIAHDRGENVIVDFDPVAHGEMLPWALGQLGRRLGPMLERAGAAELAKRVDPGLLAERLPELSKLAEETESELAARLRTAN
jgi:hypothetical protein